jgi:hypothetical protein
MQEARDQVAIERERSHSASLIKMLAQPLRHEMLAWFSAGF